MVGLLSAVLFAVSTASLGAHAAPSRRSDLSSFLSQSCQNTLEGLITSPASTCLNLPGTIGIFSTVANSSWIPPINTWLSTFCSEPDCTSDQLNATFTTVANGCSTDLAPLQVSTDELVNDVIQYFPLAKEALCLRDAGHGDQLCAITSLTALQTALGGPLTPTLVLQNYQVLFENNFALAKQISCTPCMAAAFAILRPALPQDLLSTIDSFVGNECGVNFTATPTGNISVVTGTFAVAAAQATASTSSSLHLTVPTALLSVVGMFSAVAALL